MSTQAPHSALYLTDLRDSVWNDEHLDLLAKSVDLGRARSLLDVGCGLGHWGRRLIPRIAPGASYTGLDMEERWVAGARERLAREMPEAAGRARFVQGSAVALPFADGEFDAATCQTVLMHLREPERAIAEMLRVIRPGGTVVCVEQNSFYHYFAWSDAMDRRPAEEIACVAEYWVRCLRGRKTLGSGDETIGDRLPAMFTAVGLEDVRVRQTDQVLHLAPPYGGHAPAWLELVRAMRASGTGQWEEPKMRARVRAGGGDDAFFERAWSILHAWAEDDEARVRAGTFSSTVGLKLFFVSGKKAGRGPASAG